MSNDTLAELLREAVEAYHHTGSIRDHADPTDKTDWNVKGIETCADPLCVDSLEALARVDSSKATEPHRHALRLETDDEYECSVCGERFKLVPSSATLPTMDVERFVDTMPVFYVRGEPFVSRVDIIAALLDVTSKEPTGG